MPLDQILIGSILSNADPSNVDRLINRCTIQLWGGMGSDNPIVFGRLMERDGSHGLTFLDFGGTPLFTSNGEPTPMYIGDGRVTRTPQNDGLLRLAPDAQRDSLINHYTGGGSWGWYPDRAVINENPGTYDNHASKWRVKFFEFGAGPFTSVKRSHNRPSTTQTAAGSISFYKPENPSWFINGGHHDKLNKNALRTGHYSAEEAAFRVRFLKLGPDLARAYYKRKLETDVAAQIACCRGNYIEGVNTQAECAHNNYESSSHRCDEAIEAFCKTPGEADNPLCGCYEGHPGIRDLPTTSQALRQVRAFPQCFVGTCTHRDAYKFANMRRNDGGVNCPNITICEQNLSMAQRAQLEDSGIVQDCAGNAADGGGGGGGGGVTGTAGVGAVGGGADATVMLGVVLAVAVGAFLAGVGAIHYAGAGTALTYVAWAGAVQLAAVVGVVLVLSRG